MVGEPRLAQPDVALLEDGHLVHEHVQLLDAALLNGEATLFDGRLRRADPVPPKP